MLEVEDGVPIPAHPREAKVEAARKMYELGDVSKKEAARRVLASQGTDGFNSYDAASQYIERRI
jgi:hypothetical protein